MSNKSRSIFASKYSDVLHEVFHLQSGISAYIPKHTHEELLLFMPMNYCINYLYMGQTRTAYPGKLSVIYPGEVHDQQDFNHIMPEITIHRMYIRSEFLLPMFQNISKTRNYTMPFIDHQNCTSTQVSFNFLYLCNALANNELRLLIDYYIIELQRHLFEQTNKLTGTKEYRDHPGIKIAKDYIQDNSAQNISLEYLANISGLSVYHFARLFKKQIGITPHSFQTNVRISNAKLMLDKKMSLKQVASEVGFYDQSHFYQYFKRIVGVTPGQYLIQKQMD